MLLAYELYNITLYNNSGEIGHKGYKITKRKDISWHKLSTCRFLAAIKTE